MRPTFNNFSLIEDKNPGGGFHSAETMRNDEESPIDTQLLQIEIVFGQCIECAKMQTDEKK